MSRWDMGDGNPNKKSDSVLGTGLTGANLVGANVSGTDYDRMRLAGSSLKSAVNAAAKAASDFLVPPRCPACQKRVRSDANGGQGFCHSCWREVRFIERPFCEIMGTPFAVDMGIGAVSTGAIANPPPFARLRSAVIYDDLARAMVSRLKFSDRHDLAPWMASVMRRAGLELLIDCDHVVPLPLHWRRRLQRRFNQSSILARLICQQADYDFRPELLQRKRHTRQQIGLTATGRKANVSGAFRVPIEYKPDLQGKHVVLVDDVYTSGASAIAATKTLLRAGAGKVDVLTFAKVHSGVL